MNVVELLTVLRDSPTEKFAVIFHCAGGVFGHIVSDGDAKTVKFDVREVIGKACHVGARMISVAHNHPTGEVRPSIKDLEATFALQDILKAQRLTLHDHVIVGPEGEPFSMRNKGVI